MQFAWARATDGPFYTDPQFARNHDVAKARGIPVGAYHFFRCNADPRAQANHFFHQTTVVGRLGTLLPMVDIEEESFAQEMDAKAALGNLGAFLHALLVLSHVRTVIIYTNYDTWTRLLGNSTDYAKLPLWLAQTVDPNKGLFGGWTDWLLWQDSTTTVPGINGPVDLDLLNPAHTLKDIML